LLGIGFGAESVLLLDFFRSLRKRNVRAIPIHVAYKNRPRPREKALFTAWKKDFPEFRWEESQVPRKPKGGREEAYRNLRYKIFSRLQEKYNAALVTAHHLDDEIETIFLNMFRGSGLRGLFPFSRGALRPFADIDKSTILSLSRGLPFVNDPENSDLRLRRNYLRKKIIPRIEKGFPGFKKQVLKWRTNFEPFIRELHARASAHVANPEKGYFFPKRNLEAIPDLLKPGFLSLKLAEIQGINFSPPRPVQERIRRGLENKNGSVAWRKGSIHFGEEGVFVRRSA